MVNYLRRGGFAAVLLVLVILILTYLPGILNPTPPDEFERKRDRQWVNSSPYWIDRQACRYLGLCGIQHLRWDAPAMANGGAGDPGDLGVGVLKLMALAWSGDLSLRQPQVEKIKVKSTTSSWETAPMISDLKRRGALSDNDTILDDIPEYVLKHAPLVHLASSEHFWPSDMADHLEHMEAWEGGESLGLDMPLNLDTIAKLNSINGTVFLYSKDDVESRPEWLHNRAGIPVGYDRDEDEGLDEDEPAPGRPTGGRTWWDADRTHPPHRITDPRRTPEKQRPPLERRGGGKSQRPLGDSEPNKGKPDASGYSNGPSVLILVDKGSGIVDAFWFFFYSYNLGQTVANIRFGNHVGDWEHCMIRFDNGIPRAMFLSEHAGGKAYAWKAMEKRKVNGTADRPVIYSAVGSHAMYALPGLHPYVLPFKMLKDITDRGPLWDPALNTYAYWYDYEKGLEEEEYPPEQQRTSLVPVSSHPDAPTNWFYFNGYWGDDIYPLNDSRQWRLFSEYHYTTGPLGPKFKYLERRKMCQTDKCIIVESIEAGEKSAWY